ncbi:hypothetical protein CQ018_10250 [Arthrobacter sp. MYb227]|uniref:hypothetical protein n=1 Tax=Arthrobacter sp. MYb227 TaxID=1848601 RepID=UPI000CFDE0C6|nr:hypothetical protein [Arthrobacter sp. MYb227]PQZ92854.1 hypothetical protein CQ018_10250 [Arthrobacter sp. MYb227]
MTSTNARIGRHDKPVTTWVLMLAGLLITLYMLLIGSNGNPAFSWFLAAPAALGLLGAWFAARNDSPGWMIASGVWGIALIPALIFAITLISGP